MTKVYLIVERDVLDEFTHSIAGYAWPGYAWLDKEAAEREAKRRNANAPESRRFDLEELELLP
jgi:hypothetical protein